MPTLNEHSSKERIVEAVDASGELHFVKWYKQELTYQNRDFTVLLHPEYRDECLNVETLQELLSCEDYRYVYVFGGTKKPWTFEWYKEGDDQ